MLDKGLILRIKHYFRCLQECEAQAKKIKSKSCLIGEKKVNRQYKNHWVFFLSITLVFEHA